MNKHQLKAKIEESLERQGYRISNGFIYPPADLDKEKLREMNALAVEHRIATAKAGLFRHESDLLTSFAQGKELVPEKIHPKLIQVESGSRDELLFRYACLHWSIPVSSGYGRRMRFLVLDEENNKLIGLFGLGDPVFNLGVRDKWVGWSKDARAKRLRNVMDAFVLGAVPPYSFLLGGKLICMLLASNEVRLAYAKKYAGKLSRIRSEEHDSRLALITTTSALGRSSIYNRIKYQDRHLFHGIGFTQGYGEFHFSNGCYAAMAEYAKRYCQETERHVNWGEGFRNRRELIKKCLKKIGISPDWLIHGIRREAFVIPLAKNSAEFLQGEHSRLLWYDSPAESLFNYFRERWLLPRSQRVDRYKTWDREEWRIWDRVTSKFRFNLPNRSEGTHD